MKYHKFFPLIGGGIIVFSCSPEESSNNDNDEEGGNGKTSTSKKKGHNTTSRGTGKTDNEENLEELEKQLSSLFGGFVGEKVEGGENESVEIPQN